MHVVTVNEYLAGRDAEWMGQIHRFLGLTVGLNLRQLTPAQKREAYNCDITYTTNAEVGFDYLRDNMVTRVEDRVLRPLNFALVDEVDSILVDESRTPLIISGGQKQTANLYIQADRFVKSLKIDEDYEIDVKSKTVQLTDSGVTKAEKAFRVKNLYELDHTQLVHHISQALKANYIMMKDVEYVVDNDEIVIVDQFTGPFDEGPCLFRCLHQAIEAKEGVSIKRNDNAGHDHLSEFLPPIQQAGRHDRYGKDGRRGILKHLQHARYGNPDQSAGCPYRLSGCDLRHQEG